MTGGGGDRQETGSRQWVESNGRMVGASGGCASGWTNGSSERAAAAPPLPPHVDISHHVREQNQQQQNSQSVATTQLKPNPSKLII
ncbi:hypothetical protein NDU88_005886 [Pleurodeles waltl]|uniref:Uncharacterized protein n=1 Tax=Pleurodeles waltl TaxID=8319 RepID=A0AAV7RMB4_PLEWA|nr:hypothetical protein NDU88_005886 [Pleurodeles waltl]